MQARRRDGQLWKTLNAPLLFARVFPGKSAKGAKRVIRELRELREFF
jgi:hypothetical protein